MASRASLGAGALGLVLLVYGVWQWISGDSWVVWVVLGVLLGGVGAARKLLGGGNDA